MAKKTRKRKAKSAKAGQSPAAPKQQSRAVQNQSRRSALFNFALLGAGGLSIGLGGVVFAKDFNKKVNEHDLSVVGQGTPVVVQIHDPQCSACAALQSQTRRAMQSFDEDTLIYRVANIRTPEGAALQRQQGLSHVTLVLFNGAGERVHVVEGVTPAAEILDAFETYLSVPTG